MKKNLIALAVLLALVAVGSQFTRKAGKNPEWTALENDMRTGLEALWQQPGQNVELVEAEGGVRAVATVVMSAQGDPTWNEPFLRFVAARHPAVSLQGLEIRGVSSAAESAVPPAGSSSDPTRRYELLRRQQQAAVDGLLGPGQGLMLLQFRDLGVAQPVPVSENRLAPAEETNVPSARARGGDSRPRDDGARQPAPLAAPPTVQRHACLVVRSDFPPDLLQKAFQGLPSDQGDNTRVLKLPPL